jgi:hypothetical protein
LTAHPAAGEYSFPKRKMSDAPDDPHARMKDRRDGPRPPASRLRTPVIGLEAEFNLYVQDEKRLPEHVFRNPQEIVREKMLPRTGRSYHLPSGGALYFDTGVVEVATPIIELEPACCLRVVRSLWEQIAFLREELDHWELRTGSTARLEGFSAHYNISVPDSAGLNAAAVTRTARLLTWLLPAPAMLLAANRLSTGIGVRPRPKRLEVTADFTPDPSLMLAATALIVGVACDVMKWPDHRLTALAEHGVPLFAGFRPRKHTSRKGFLARQDCFPENPFLAGPNGEIWQTTDGRTMSLRQIALEIARPFRRTMREMADPETVRHLFKVLGGKARSLLDFENRPRRYEDVGRVIDWRRRRRIRELPRSKYERVIHRIITHRPISVDGEAWRPERMQGWYEVVFRQVRTGRRRVFNLDDLVTHCEIG